MRARPLRVAAVVAYLIPAATLIAAPGTGPLAVLGFAVAVLIALHGCGRLVAAWARDDDAPLGLILAWGLALYLAIAGALIAIGWYGLGGRLGLVVAGTVLGAGWTWQTSKRWPARVPVPRLSTILGVACAVAILAVLVLAAAGRWSGPFHDAETDYLGQLRRLDDTGTLGDGFGFPRAAGLGGQLALAALADVIDPRASYAVDRGVMLVIVTVLAATMVRGSRRAALAAAIVVPIAMTAVSEYLLRMAPYGSLVALFAAMVLTIERAHHLGASRTFLAAVLLAAAATTIAHAAVVVLFGVIAIGSLLASRWGVGTAWRRSAAVIAVGVIAPYIVAALRARASSVRPELVHASGPAIAVAVTAAVLLGLVIGLGVRRRVIAMALLVMTASVLAAGVLAPVLAASTGYAVAVAVTVLLVVALLAIAEPERLAADPDVPARVPAGTSLVAVTAVVGLLAAARFQNGQPLLGWRNRLHQLVDDARSVGELPVGPASQLATVYAAAQATIPAGARLGIWAQRADLVDYHRNPVTDLRSPAARRLAASLSSLPVDYVLVDQAAPGDAWRALAPRATTSYNASGLLVLAIDRGAN